MTILLYLLALKACLIVYLGPYFHLVYIFCIFICSNNFFFKILYNKIAFFLSNETLLQSKDPFFGKSIIYWVIKCLKILNLIRYDIYKECTFKFRNFFVIKKN